MNGWKRHIALFVVIANVMLLQAVANPPIILRACLDRTNSTLTVYFKSPTDACNSFTKYELYGRDNASNPFNALTSLSVLNASQIVTVLPNKKKWELFLTALYACNGVDTLYSDTIFIDDQPPVYIEPDSVSVDLTTQQLRVGWSKAPEPDVMGYWIYKQDATTGNNILLDEQNMLTYLFGLSTFDTKKAGNKVEISAFDSCRNGGVISNFHSPILVQFNTGQNANYLCTRKLIIDWSAYVGWVAGSYDILVWDSKSGLWKLDGTVSGGTLTYTYNIPKLGESYSFAVRAHNAARSISSLSNRIDINLLDFAKPLYNEIGHVSVVGSSALEITGKWEYSASISKVILQTKPYGSSAWNTLSTPLVSAGFLKYIDNGKSTSTTKYDYRLVLFNSCGTAFDTSVTHTNIVLRKSAFTLSWNAYWGWKNKTEVTDLLYRPKQGFTWNTKNAWPDSSETLIDTTVAVCFRVASVLIGLNNKPIDTAWSNEVCLRVFDTTLIPDGFSPGGLNPIFKIINPNLEPGQATMLIFNRWGQKQFEGDALTGWDGKDNKGEFMGPGFYPYLVNIKTPEKRESRKGVVMIIR